MNRLYLVYFYLSEDISKYCKAYKRDTSLIYLSQDYIVRNVLLILDLVLLEGSSLGKHDKGLPLASSVADD
jgi:hypothetical protein